MRRTTSSSIWIILLVLGTFLQVVSAEEYPSKPLELLVPLPPGTSMDIMARLISDRAPKEIGQTVVVVNRAGGAGSIAAAEIIKAKPDGYKIFYGTNIYFGLTVKTQKIPFDPNQLIPIMTITEMKDGMAVAANSPFKTFADLLSFAKKNPGKLRWAHSGRGLRDHAAWLLVFKKAGIETVDVPYHGSPEKLAALLGGHVDASCMAYAPIRDHLKSGKLRYLAVSSSQRYSDLPDVPTMTELGFPEIAKFAIMTGFFVHKDTPQEIRQKISDLFGKICKDAEFKKTVDGLGDELRLGGPDLMREAIKNTEELGTPILKELGLYVGK